MVCQEAPRRWGPQHQPARRGPQPQWLRMTSWVMRWGTQRLNLLYDIYIYIMIMIYYVIYYVIASGISMMSLFGGVREKHTSWESWALDSVTPGHSSQTPAGRQMLHSTQLSVENRGSTGKQMTTTHGSCEETWRVVFAFNVNVWDTNITKHLQTVTSESLGLAYPLVVDVIIVISLFSVKDVPNVPRCSKSFPRSSTDPIWSRTQQQRQRQAEGQVSPRDTAIDHLAQMLWGQAPVGWASGNMGQVT